MTTYLSGGWYQPDPPGGLRTEVIDGAMDAAGMLHRAGIRAERLSLLALKVRSLMSLADPHMRGGGLGEEERQVIVNRLADTIGDSPELYSFTADCIEHVTSARDLMGFYLHLMHVARMVTLLSVAKLAPTAPPARRATAKKPAPKAAKTRKPAKKKSVKKSPVKKKSPAKKRARIAK